MPKPVRRFKPLPIGTLVTGRSTKIDISFHPGGLVHPVEIVSTPKKVEWSEAGFSQDAYCLICNTTFFGVDGEFLKIKVSKKELETAVTLVRSKRRDLQRAEKRIMEQLNAT